MDELTISALVLAGGQSKRMGTDKVTVEVEGETFLERGIRFWKQVPEVSEIYVGIGSEEHLAEIKKDPKIKALLEDADVIPVLDIHKGCGPLAGIEAAFMAGGMDYLYVSAIDVLNISEDMVPHLDEDMADAYIYRRDDNVEPLFGLYSNRVLGTVSGLIEEGIFKIRKVLDRVDTKYLPIGDDQLDLFINCNTKEELERFKAIKSQESPM